MKPQLQRTDEFNADFEQQYDWYLEHASEEVAERFLRAVAETLSLLGTQPNIGRHRKFRHPKLQNLFSFKVGKPFQKMLIFYRYDGRTLEIWRLMHGARDLPQRLAEPLQ